MIVALEDASPVPKDARRAARRSRDAWLAGAEGVRVVESADPEAARAEARLLVREHECVVGPRALERAACALLRGASAVAPEGFYGARVPPEAYVTVWEFEALAGERASAEPPSEAVALAPVELRRSGGGPARTAPGCFVHSFAGRRGHERPEVAGLVPPGTRRVLEIGCAEGFLGAALEARGARVTGIEPDADAARVASARLTRVISSGVEECLGELDAGFGAVVAADVLEHLEAPVSTLLKLRELMANGAVLVFSVPNASHAAVLAGALSGRWDHALEGIVADDHRTYAGRTGWERLLAAAGFSVEEWRPVPARTPRAEPWIPALSHGGLEVEELTAVQWLGIAKPAGPPRPLPDAAPVPPVSLDLDDPIGDARARIAEGRPSVRARNAVAGGALETLLTGGLATGEIAAALAEGLTACGLAARFRGSGVEVDAVPASEAPPPAVVARVVEESRARGLPVAEDALRAAELDVRFRAS